MSMKEQNIIDTFFDLRQDDMLEEMDTDRASLRNVLKQINQKELKNIINTLPDEYETVKKDLYEKIDNLVGDYEIKMAYYNKKYYKQGFHDAIMINSKCKENAKK